MDINLNADLGESFGAYRMGDDAALLAIVGSANVACGFHGGDPMVMAETVRLAREHGVSIGAHPAFPDLQGFGRRADDAGATRARCGGHVPGRRLDGHGAIAGRAGHPREAARCDEQHGLRRSRRWPRRLPTRWRRSTAG